MKADFTKKIVVDEIKTGLKHCVNANSSKQIKFNEVNVQHYITWKALVFCEIYGQIQVLQFK